jgi:indole-3-glycerol phosphate synthase
LRKDFVIDPVQVLEARHAGASAVLLIAECLSAARMKELVELTHQWGMSALVELYDADNLPAVLDSGARLVGINNRDLRTFEVSLSRTLDLLDRIPSDRLVISESGIASREDVALLHHAGVRAILVGEAFMRADDPGKRMAELLA